MNFAHLITLVETHAHKLFTLDQTGLIDESSKRPTSTAEPVLKQAGERLMKRVCRIIGVEGDTLNGRT